MVGNSIPNGLVPINMSFLGMLLKMHFFILKTSNDSFSLGASPFRYKYNEV